MRTTSRRIGVLACALVLFTATTASAQVIGTFRWQLAPYCNVVTLTVSQVGSAFRLDGDDDLCGAAVHAPATGIANVNASGVVSMGITIVRNDGITVQSAASISLPALTGTWSDDFGNSGTFAFNAPSPSPGTPRRLTLRGNYNVSTPAVPASDTAISFGRPLPAAPHAVFMRLDSPPNANCPGTAAAPEALPGYFCVYEAVTSNIFGGAICHGTAHCDGFADRWGGLLDLVLTDSSLRAYNTGTWAVTP
jgi:hypothetical protein